MEFKIDTKTSYTQIAPVDAHIDANMAAALRQKWLELTETGSGNFIIDLQACTTADIKALHRLGEWHEDSYANHQSLVFAQVQPGVMEALRAEEVDAILNIAPTTIEAVDIISMEVLERDLFGEEG